MNRILKNFSYTLLSNIASLVISTLITFVLPKWMGVESYGYVQLYVFYVSYTGFLHFGWADGIFLRYGGEYYENLNLEKFSGQYRLYCLIELFFSISIALVVPFVVDSTEKSIVFMLIGVSIILSLPRTFLQYVLQGTNRIKEYAMIIVTEKFIYLLSIVCVILIGNNSFVSVIVADLLGKMSALIYAMWQCRGIISSKASPLKYTLVEMIENIKVGSRLMFSNLAGMLIIGIVRWAIEFKWDVATFGKISLTMSVSNLLMIFIRAVAMLMFPLLRRTDSEKFADIYKTLRTLIMIPLFGMLIFYYPMKEILSLWLPKYVDSLRYMALLFPMCIFESKMSMLIETYMKTMRKEKELLFVNLATVILSAVLTGITVFYFGSLDWAVFLIVLLLAFRCILAEILLATSLEIDVIKDICFEVVLSLGFISVSWILGGINGMLIYVLVYVVYLVLKAKDIRNVMRTLKRLKRTLQ